MNHKKELLRSLWTGPLPRFPLNPKLWTRHSGTWSTTISKTSTTPGYNPVYLNLNPQPKSLITLNNIGALIIRIGFGGFFKGVYKGSITWVLYHTPEGTLYRIH